MKKIVFGITSLGLGGAERVLVDIANKLCNEYDITLFLIYGNGELEKELSPNIKVEHLCHCSYEELTKEERRMVSIKIMLFKERIYKIYINRKFDVEIAFLEGPITRLFACYGNRKKKIAWVHNDISKVFGTGFKAFVKKKIDKQNYRRYNKLVFVSDDNKKAFEKIYRIGNKKQVIYNYIDSNKVISKSNEKQEIEFSKNNFNIVTVARLVEQKAIDRLIRVHKRLIDNNISNTIYVIGDGPKKEELEELIKKNNVQETFKLLGKQKNPYPYIKACDLFCLLSNFEGYPMTIIEAKILNKYIAITNTAAREALEGYSKCDIFENNEEEIYKGLSNLIKNKNTANYKIENDTMYNNQAIIEQIKELLKG